MLMTRRLTCELHSQITPAYYTVAKPAPRYRLMQDPSSNDLYASHSLAADHCLNTADHCRLQWSPRWQVPGITAVTRTLV